MKSNGINIVILSDLNWEPHLRSITDQEVADFEPQDLNIPRYERIARYFNIIRTHKAELVLLAGDITGDGACGRGFHKACMILMKLLEMSKTHCLFISGNHDPDVYYGQLVDYCKNLEYVEEISGKVVQKFGLNIIGVNYDTSKSKRELKKLLATKPKNLDIVLAHSQTKRRIRHFDIGAKYIFTGHYDRKLLSHRASCFVALDNDSDEVSYAVLTVKQDDTDDLGIYIRQNPETTFSYTEKVDQLLVGKRNRILCVNDSPAFDLLKLENASDASLSRDGEFYLYLKYLRGINYASSLDTMYKMKNGLPLDVYDLSLNQMHGLPITANYQISESMIEDYLGNVIE